MGILDMLLGGAGGGNPFDRLTGDMGSKGGLLQKFGKGRYGDMESGGGLGGLGEGGMNEFLQQLMPQGGPQGGGSSPQPQYPQQQAGQAPAGLPDLIMRYLQQQRR